MKAKFFCVIFINMIYLFDAQLMGQELNIIKYENQDSVLCLGKSVWLKITGIKNVPKEIKLSPINTYQLNINGIEINDLKYSFLADSSMILKFKVPLNKDVIGMNKVLQLEDVTQKKLYSKKVNVSAEKPIFKPDVNDVIYKGDNYKRIQINGNNLTSVCKIWIDDSEIIIEPEFDIFEDGKKLTIRIKALNNCIERDKIIIKYLYNDGTETRKEDSSVVLLSVYQKQNEQNIDINPKNIFLDDIQRLHKVNAEITFLDDAYNSNRKFRFKPEAILYTKQNKLIATLIFDEKVKIGEYNYEITDDADKTFLKKFTISIVDKPKINSITGGINNNLQFNPYRNAKITLKGENLEHVRFFIVDDDESFIEATENTKRSSDFYKEVNLKFQSDKIPFKNFKYGLLRESADNKEIIYEDFGGALTIIPPKKVFNLNNFVTFETDDSSGIKINERKTILTEKKLFVNADNQKIPSDKGAQAVGLKATLYDADGNLVDTKEYQDKRLGSAYFLVSTDRREYEKSSPQANWDIYKEFQDKIRPWNKIKVEMYHYSTYYSETNETPDYYSQEILIQGKWYDNLYSTITLPQTLFVFGQRDKLRAEVLPINIGYGIEYQHRNKKTGEKWPISFGAYLSGLNFLNLDKQDSTIITQTIDSTANNRTITTKIINDTNKRLIDKGSLSIMILTQVFIFNKDKKMRLPLQIGTGWTLPVNGKRLQWFGVVGFGLTYEF
jgi:hypothetical protein